MHKVKVLEITHGLAPGGIESFVLNVFEHIDRNKFRLDFAVASNGRQFHEERVEKQGGVVYHTNDLNGIIPMIKHSYRLFKLLKKNDYDVVHTQIDFFNGINLFIAFLARVPIRISHSHNTHSANATATKVGFKKKLYRLIMRALINTFATERLGCSQSANFYMYGEKYVDKEKTKVIYNGINIGKFSNIRHKKNAEKINNRIELITIGRMCEQKNSLYIVEIMKNLKQLGSYHLTWIGSGPLKEQINKKISEYEIQDTISLIGNSHNVSDYLTTSDYFLFPSKWEGLGIVLIEAQSCGVPCFISDRIPEEANLGLCTVLSLELDAYEWAKKMHELINKKLYNNELNQNKKNYYDIKNIVDEISKIYCNKQM